LSCESRAARMAGLEALAETVDELRLDRRHGGSWAARLAVEALAATAADVPASSGEELLERLAGGARELSASRPGLVAVAGALGRLLAAARSVPNLPLDDLRLLVQAEAQGLVDSRDRAARVIAIQLAERLAGADVVTRSASATVREALLHGSPTRVVCTVTQPHEEGRQLAEELQEAGVDAEVVDDGDGAAAVRDADLVLVGADTVFRDGTLENKIGTRPLAEAAAAAGVPVVVACEVIKLAPVTAAEAGVHEAPGALFDLTPPELVSEVVTEEGAYPADGIRTLVDRTPFLRDGWALLSR
jgi:translation initiation factor 2B subunit (eIF-2B alpha/beta/delta family)